ncbi:HEAT repeat domain-containing protein, partial [bacterium]|nr:HEAT repeat domain-containing protein [bacterium]
MKLIRKVFLVSILSVFSFSMFAQQQSVQRKSEVQEVEAETSVENEYLNDVDGDIIMSLANSDELDNKLVALQYLQNAIDEGNTSETVIKALDQLAGEGLTNQSRTNGRLMNNFPEVRRQACLM